MHILKLDIKLANSRTELSLHKGINLLIHNDKSVLENIERRMISIFTDKRIDNSEEESISEHLSMEISEKGSIFQLESKNSKKLPTSGSFEKFAHTDFIRTSTSKKLTLENKSSNSSIFNSFIQISQEQEDLNNNDSDNSIETYSLNSLRKDLELLEIKSMRRNKLIKELKSITKNFNKIDKKIESLEEQKKVLENLNTLYDNNQKINRSIEELESQIAEIKDIELKVSEIEAKTNEIFPNKPNLNSKNNKSLEEIQDIFSSIRDMAINLDSNALSKKTIFASLIKNSMGIITFFSIIFLFIFIKTSMDIDKTLMLTEYPIIVGSTLLFLNLVLGMVRLKKISSSEEINLEKVTEETKLLEYIEENNFEIDGYKSGELYEFLLQHFEDHIRYEELNEEAVSLKNKIKLKTDSQILKAENETMKKSLNENSDKIDSTIDSYEGKTKNDLRSSEISNLISDIEDEMNEMENERDSILPIQSKVSKEIEEYDKLDKNGPYFDDKIKDLKASIKSGENKKTIIETIRPLLDESTVEWQEKFLKENIDETIVIFNDITKNEYSDIINKEILNEYYTKSIIPEDLPSDILFLPILIIQYLINLNTKFRLPPYIINVYEKFDYIKNIPSFMKILLELSKHRQVIIYSNRSFPESELSELYI